MSFAGAFERDHSLPDPEFRAELPQRNLGVIAGTHRFAHDRLARGEQPAEEHACFHLRARHRQRVIERVQRGSPDYQRRETILPRFEAPICASGFMIRSMGRRERDSSPKMRLTKGCAASNPDIMRMVEPEFPASRSSACFQPSSPRPWMVTAVPCSSTPIPSARTHPSVEWQSAPVE